MPGPFTLTSAVLIPCSMAFLTASRVASCAAKGVLLRDPLNPKRPALDCAITLPDPSVTVTIVLLNVDWMCTTPVGTFFFSFLPFVLALAAFAMLRP